MKKTLIAITLFSASLTGVLEAAELNGSQTLLSHALYYSDAKRDGGWTDKITIADPGLKNYTISVRLDHNKIEQLIPNAQTSKPDGALFSFSDGATTLKLTPNWKSVVGRPVKYYLTGFGGMNLDTVGGTSNAANALFDRNNPVDLQQLGITFTVSASGTTKVYIGMMVGGKTTNYEYSYTGSEQVTNLKELVLNSNYVTSAYILDGVVTKAKADGLNWTSYTALYESENTDDNDQPGGDSPSVPEPTTATLSLMALAALAARRRRRA